MRARATRQFRNYVYYGVSRTHSIMNSADESADEPRYDAFISYSRNDHDAIVRPLYERLTEMGLRIWKREVRIGDTVHSSIGDEVHNSIRRGMRSSDHGIVVLSESFLNSGFPMWELTGLLDRQEEYRHRKVLIPLHYGVDERTASEHSYSLTRRHAITITEDNVESVAQRLYRVITEDSGETAAVQLDEAMTERDTSEIADRTDRTVVDAGVKANTKAPVESPTETGTATGSRGPRVFLSQSKADRLIMNEIKDSLESNGIEVYIYQADKQPGEPIPKKVTEAIDASDLMIAIQTLYSADSEWIRDEMVYAAALKVPLVPILESSLPPLGGILGKDMEVIRYTAGEEEQLIEDLMRTLHHLDIGVSDEEIEELGTIMGASIEGSLEQME